MNRVAVVGANGRVGRGLSAELVSGYDLKAIVRQQGERPSELAERAVSRVDVVINAAGVAHVDDPTGDDLMRLRAANVDWPATLAASCLAARVHLVHISSVKASATSEDKPYASSKREGDRVLIEEFGESFADHDLHLAIVRPLALLYPPLDAGKLRLLRPVSHLPPWLTPPVRLPVLTKQVFEDAVRAELESALSGRGGCVVRQFGRNERGTLRDIRDVFRKTGVSDEDLLGTTRRDDRRPR